MCNEEKAQQSHVYRNSGGIGVGAQGLAGPGTTQANWPPTSPDPMHMTVSDLIREYNRLRYENKSLRTEVSAGRLRVAEMEHERTVSAASRL